MRDRIYTSQQIEAARRVLKNRESSASLGSSALFTNIPGTSFPVAESEWLTDDWSVVAKKRLLTVTSRDRQTSDPGSWIISLAGSVGEQTAGLAEAASAPMVAVIGYGTGGISQVVEVDAWRSIVTIPADDFTLDVGYRRPGTLAVTDANNRVATGCADNVRISASVHRGSSSDISQPTATYYLNQRFNAAQVIERIVPVPSQAVAWNLSLPEQMPIGSAPISGVANGRWQVEANFPPAGPVQLDTVDDAILVNMIRNGCFRPISPLARLLNVRFDVSSMSGLIPWGFGVLTFRLGL